MDSNPEVVEVVVDGDAQSVYVSCPCPDCGMECGDAYLVKGLRTGRVMGFCPRCGIFPIRTKVKEVGVEVQA